MKWNCRDCGVENDGGLFCIGCGTKKPDQVHELPDATPNASLLPQQAPRSSNLIPWIATGAVLVATLAFGGWQSSLASSAEELASTTTTELADARQSYNVALDTAETADSSATVCRYASWCWASTYRILLEDAESAHDLADAYRAEVTNLESVLAEAESDFDRYTSGANAGWGIGGLGTLGCAIWAFVDQGRRKRNQNV